MHDIDTFEEEYFSESSGCSCISLAMIIFFGFGFWFMVGHLMNMFLGV